MRYAVLITSVAFVALVGSTGCATKGYVGTEIAQVSDELNGRIDAVSASVEDAQERTRQNAEEIQKVDQRAAAAGEQADAANRAAEAAQTDATSALELAEAADGAARKLVYEVVLSEAQGNFGFGATQLNDAMKAELDQVVERLKASSEGVYLEIEGHTDSTGEAGVNQIVGLRRAEAVRDYLHEQHGVALRKMNVVSRGEDEPVAPNNTREGRAQNRRVVIKLMG